VGVGATAGEGEGVGVEAAGRGLRDVIKAGLPISTASVASTSKATITALRGRRVSSFTGSGLSWPGARFGSGDLLIY
jgi:hypothetical protein